MSPRGGTLETRTPALVCPEQGGQRRVRPRQAGRALWPALSIRRVFDSQEGAAAPRDPHPCPGPIAQLASAGTDLALPARSRLCASAGADPKGKELLPPLEGSLAREGSGGHH